MTTNKLGIGKKYWLNVGDFLCWMDSGYNLTSVKHGDMMYEMNVNGEVLRLYECKNTPKDMTIIIMVSDKTTYSDV
ncbi:MAG TPA: hypothetical protein VJH34_00500 [archaeon]|nr:hypothetical protein [archaeon]